MRQLRALGPPRTPRASPRSGDDDQSRPQPSGSAGGRPPLAPDALPTASADASPAAPLVKLRAWPSQAAAPSVPEEKWAAKPAAAPGCVDLVVAGRWLVMTNGGCCLLAHDAADMEALRELPIAKLCSLAAAILQFMAAASGMEEQRATVGAGSMCWTHTIACGAFVLTACKGEDFSVVAVLPAQSSANGEAHVRCKTVEIYHCLHNELGPTLRDVAAASAKQRQERMDNYTLSSMLDGEDGDDDVQLSPRSKAAAEAVVGRCLRCSYDELLRLAWQGLDADERLHLECLCIIDHHSGIVASSMPDIQPSGEPGCKRTSCGIELLVAAVGELKASSHSCDHADGCSASASGAAASAASCEPTLWCWARPPMEHAAVTEEPCALVGPPIGVEGGGALPLRVAAQVRCATKAIEGAAEDHGRLRESHAMNVMRISLQADVSRGNEPRQSPLVPYVLIWTVSEISRLLALSFGCADVLWPECVVPQKCLQSLQWGTGRAGTDGLVQPAVLE